MRPSIRMVVAVALATGVASNGCRRGPAPIERDDASLADARQTDDSDTRADGAPAEPRLLYRRSEGGIRTCKTVGDTIFAPEDGAVVEVGNDTVVRHAVPDLRATLASLSPTWVVTGGQILWTTSATPNDLRVMELATSNMLPFIRLPGEVMTPKVVDGRLVFRLHVPHCSKASVKNWWGCEAFMSMPVAGGPSTALIEMQESSITDYVLDGDDLYSLRLSGKVLSLNHTVVSKKTEQMLFTTMEPGCCQLQVVDHVLWYASQGALYRIAHGETASKVVWSNQRLGDSTPFKVIDGHVYGALPFAVVDFNLASRTETTLAKITNATDGGFVRTASGGFRWCSSQGVYAWP